MTESIINIINHIQPEAFIALVLTFGVGLIVATISIVGGFVYYLRKHEAEMNLKHEMITRGMSADEIKTVLEATTKK